MNEQERLRQVVIECRDRAPLEVVLTAGTAFQLAGLMQLVLRHPHVDGTNRFAAIRFVTGVRRYFTQAPTATAVLSVLHDGDDPQKDRPPDHVEDTTLAAAELSTVLRGWLRTRLESDQVQASALAYELAAVIALHAPSPAAALEVIDAFTANMKDQLARCGVGVEHP
jgi:hypothetical protein